MTGLEEALDTLMNQVPEAMFAAVGGMDGLLVEQIPADRDELPEVVAELTTVVSVARRTVGELLAGGSIDFLSVKADRVSVGIWIVSEEFYCLVASRSPIDMVAIDSSARDIVGRIRSNLT